MKPVNIISVYQNVKTFMNIKKEIDFNKIKNDFEIKKHEAETLIKLIEELKLNGAGGKCFYCYYVGYSIKQIGKEFDLLRFSSDIVINIELKSKLEEKIKIKKITKQMEKNYYYLKFLHRKILVYTFVEDDGMYKYNAEDNKAEKVDYNEVVEALKNQKVDLYINPDNLFVPSNYLVSPFNKTENFLKNEYFLTGQQADIKKQIFKDIEKDKYKLYCISANAGTGKTLLLYDIAKTLYSQKKQATIIHCGMLNTGQEELIRNEFKIYLIKEVKDESIENIFNKMNFILIDEAHRIREFQLKLLIKKSAELKISMLFAYDTKQALGSEEAKDIYNYLEENNKDIEKQLYTLSSKIRSNKEIASFIKNLFQVGSAKDNTNYDNITIEFFSDIRDVRNYIAVLKEEEQWKEITYTTSKYNFEPLDFIVDRRELNAHQVIGQEFKKVVFIMDTNFRYNGKKLEFRKGGYYRLEGMLYQIVTRATDELKIIVYKNYDLFLRLIEIKNCKFIENNKE